MSLEILSQLEQRIQQAVDTINELKRENAQLQENNQQLDLLINESSDETNALRQEIDALKQEQQMWQQRIQSLLGKINEIAQ